MPSGYVDFGVHHVPTYNKSVRAAMITSLRCRPWHRDLLVQMSGGLAGTRPPVLDEAARDCLEAYRGFRHVVRNVYTYNLDPQRVTQLAGQLPGCYERVAGALTAFAVFLDTLR